MAYDFLGTFNKSQLTRFLAYARSQLPLAAARVNHLEAEKSRIGVVVFRFAEGGAPATVVADPPESYLGKLFAAYEVLGGDPFHDLRLRNVNQPIYVMRGTETVPAQYMSSGDVLGARGLADGDSALLMQTAKRWLEDTMQRRFGRLERKIRRALDYSDQLQAEIDVLQRIVFPDTYGASLEGIATQLEQLIADPNYRAIYDDAGADPFGFNTYAPFSSYDVQATQDPNAVDRTADTAQRQNSGFVGPGEKG